MRNLATWLRYATKNVFRNRRRALVTVLIGAVGTGAILVATGFASFSFDMLVYFTTRESGHIIIAHKDYWSREEGTPLEMGLENYQDLVAEIEKDPRVEAAVARIWFTGLASNGQKSVIYIAEGVEPRQFALLGPSRTIIEGRFLSQKPSKEGGYEAILGKDLGKGLKAGPGGGLTLLATTAQGSLNALDVDVKGIFSTGFQELDKRLLYIHLDTAQELLQSKKVSKIVVFLHKTEDTDAVYRSLRQKFPRLGFRLWEEEASYYRAMKGLYDRAFGIMGGIIIVMVFFATSNTMSMAVVERTREIGTERAMGAFPGEIVRNFALEAAVMGAGAVLLGMALAGLVAWIFATADLQMPPPPMRLEGYPLRLSFNPGTWALTSMVMVGIFVSAAWFASRRAAHTPIVEALSHV